MEDETGKGGNTAGNEAAGENNEQSGDTGNEITQEMYDKVMSDNADLVEREKHAVSQAVVRKGKIREQDSELEALRKDKADKTTDTGEKDKQYQDIFDKLKNEKDAMQSELREIKVFGLVRAEANKLNVINADDVVSLIKGLITFDDKGATIIKGGTPNAATAKPYTLAELTAEFLHDRQYLIKSSGNRGAGSADSTGGSTGAGRAYTPAEIKAMSSEQYIQAKKDGGGSVRVKT